MDLQQDRTVEKISNNHQAFCKVSYTKSMDSPYITYLECSGCGKTYSHTKVHTFCSACQSPLLSKYDLISARQELDRDQLSRRPKGMWRWHELLPVLDEENRISLGEGDTPLLSLPRLQKELGLTNLTPYANIEESRMAGAEVILVDGLISDAAGMAGEKARAEGWFDVSTFKEPYRVEGKKVMGYELAESFGWELPDVVIYPTGGGTGLVGMWKAFAELEELGWLENTKRPRMVSVQADGCAPVVRAFEKHASFCDFWLSAHTLASGLRVPKSFADHLILEDIYNSNGMAVAVSDEAILASQKELARLEGIFAAPEGAATLAALRVLIEKKWVNPEERIVLFNTGSGLKYITPHN